MRILIILTLVIFIYSNIYADTNKIHGVANIGVLESELLSNKNSSNEKKEFQNIKFVNFQFSYKYQKNNFRFLISPFFYFSKSMKPIFCIGTNSIYENNNIFLRTVFISYVFNNTTIGFGILPFYNGINNKFNYDYIKNGEGISILNNYSITGIYFKQNFQNSYFSLVYGKVSDSEYSGRFVPKEFEEKTKILLANYNFKIKKVEFDLEYDHSLLFYKNMHIANSNNLGLNFQTFFSNINVDFYGSFGISRYKNKNANFGEEILESNDIPLIAKQLYPNSFSINNKTFYGGAIFIGLRKNFSLNFKDYFINYEYFKTYGDWFSNNSGNLYNNGKITDSFLLDSSHYIKFGFYINNKTQISVSTSFINPDKIKIGSPERGESLPGQHINSINTFSIQLRKRF